MRIGFVVHTERRDALALMRELGDDLGRLGHQISAPAADADHADRPGWARSDGAFGTCLDLVIALGGDGTTLRAARLTHAVPILCVNLGRLGYLAEVEPGSARAAVEQFLRGKYDLDERMTVTAELAPERRSHSALNEMIVTGGEVGRIAHLALGVGDDEFTTYSCDALIVATPTGSTAYSLSAGGPIVSPALDCLIVVPVAAHGLFARPLVLRPDEGLALRSTDRIPAAVSADGHRVDELSPGSELRLAAGRDRVPFVRLDEFSFLRLLRTKLMER